MPILIPRRKVWTRQPQTLVGVDWSNPLARGLVQCVVRGYDFAKGERGTATSTIQTVLSQRGLGTRVSNTAGTTEGISFTATPVSNGPLTQFVFLGNYEGVGALSYAYAIGNYNSSGTGIAVAHSAVSGRWGVFDYNGLTDAGETLAVGSSPFLLSVRGRSGNDITLYRDGVQKATTANMGGSSAANNAPFYVNSLGSAGIAWSCQSPIVLAGRFNRALSDAEVKEFSANPWQVFRPQSRRIFFDLGAGGGTLNASASGAATASGTATLSADVGLAAIGVAVAGGSASPGANIPVTAAGLAVSGGSANAVATVSIAAADLAQAAGQAGLSATVLLQAAGAAQASGNATLAASLEALASGSAQASGSATLSGGAPGALSASGSAEASGQAVLTVSVQLAAAGAAQASGSATGSASAPGSISASGGAIAGGFSTWSALVTLTAAGFVQAMGSGSFVVDVPLAATGQATAGGQATPSTAGAAGGCWLHSLPPRRVTLAIADHFRATRIIHGVRRV